MSAMVSSPVVLAAKVQVVPDFFKVMSTTSLASLAVAVQWLKPLVRAIVGVVVVKVNPLGKVTVMASLWPEEEVTLKLPLELVLNSIVHVVPAVCAVDEDPLNDTELTLEAFATEAVSPRKLSTLTTAQIANATLRIAPVRFRALCDVKQAATKPPPAREFTRVRREQLRRLPTACDLDFLNRNKFPGPRHRVRARFRH